MLTYAYKQIKKIRKWENQGGKIVGKSEENAVACRLAI